jgi:uncharacterized protein (DUF1697 family)
MKTFISMLRGINVGGSRTITMDNLKCIYEDLGLLKVTTYIQSGNVIFQAMNSEASGMGALIEKHLKNITGFEIPVMVLSIDELKSILKRNPFLSESSRDSSFMHVTFLSQVPDKAYTHLLGEKKSEAEELAIEERAVYLYLPSGYGKTLLTNSFIERKLKVKCTTRNWRTALALMAIAEKTDNLY